MSQLAALLLAATTPSGALILAATLAGCVRLGGCEPAAAPRLLVAAHLADRSWRAGQLAHLSTAAALAEARQELAIVRAHLATQPSQHPLQRTAIAVIRRWWLAPPTARRVPGANLAGVRT